MMKFFVGVKKVPDGIFSLLSLYEFEITNRADPCKLVDHLPERTGPFDADLINLSLEPLFYQLQCSGLVATTFQLFDGVASFIQGYVMARHHSGVILRCDETEHVAFAAGVGAIWVPVVETRR
jgi:hypothetical protein